MHAYRKFVQLEMDKRGWSAADLQRASGLTKQNLSRILNDDRVQMQQRPDPATVAGLARAFGINEVVVLSHVSEAMGLPTGRVQISAAADFSNDELLRVLAERLSRGDRDAHDPLHSEEPGAPRSPSSEADASGDVESPAQPDGITLGERRRPLTRDDFDRAADDSGPSLLEADDARAAVLGEESQDPGHDDPA